MLERLQKIISRAGIASRRHAEDLIRSGQVRVNGVVVTELGAKADPENDRVEAAGKVARPSEARVYLLMNKPPEVVATLADPEGRPTLRNFLVGVSARVFPVGRLEYAAAGAILLTNDGDLAARMLKALAVLPQTYWIKVKGRLNDSQMKTLAQSLGGKVFPLRAPHAAGKNPANPWYEAQVSGASRELLRPNLLAIGHPVEKQKRIKVASLDAGTVPEGQYRQLDAQEVAKLVHAVDLALAKPKSVLPAIHAKRSWRPRRDMSEPRQQPMPRSGAPSQPRPPNDSRSNFRPNPGFHSNPPAPSNAGFTAKENFRGKFNSPSRPDSRPRSDFRSKPDFRSNPGFKPKSNFGSKSNFRPKSGFHSKPSAPPNAGFSDRGNFRGKPTSPPRPGSRPASDFRGKPDFRSKPGFKPKSNFGSKSEFRPKPGFGSKPRFNPKSNFGSKPDHRSKPAFGSKPDFRSKSNFRPPSDFKSKSDFKPRPDFNSRSGFKPKSGFQRQSNFKPKSGFKGKPNFKSRPPQR